MAIINDAYNIVVTPTITTAAYVANYIVGGIMTLTNAVGENNSGGTALLEDMLVIDAANQKAALEVFFFNSNPAAGVFTNGNVITWSTDNKKVIARVPIAATDYATQTSQGFGSVSNLGRLMTASGSANLYAVAVTTGTPTYGVDGALTLVFKFLPI